jgi:hypothetical protein
MRSVSQDKFPEGSIDYNAVVHYNRTIQEVILDGYIDSNGQRASDVSEKSDGAFGREAGREG